MKLDHLRTHTRRILVPNESLLPSDDFDYADAFEIVLDGPDPRSAESWARTALEQAPGWMRAAILLAHRGVLQFRPADEPSASQILGFSITHLEPDALRLEIGGSLLHATLVARRRAPEVVGVATYLWFRRPVTPWLWKAVGPLHRAFVPRLLRYAAGRPAPM